MSDLDHLGRSRRAGALLVSLVILGCTTPYRLDAGVDAGGGGDADASFDTPSDAGPVDASIDAPVLLDAVADGEDALGCTPSCSSPTQLLACGTDPVTCDLGCEPSPTPHCRAMVIANVDAALSTVPRFGDFESATGIIDTDRCAWTTPSVEVAGRVLTMEGGGDACVFHFSSLLIVADASVSARGALPVIIVSEGELNIAGALDADSLRARGTMAGAGAGTGGSAGDPGTMFGPGGGGGGGHAGAGGEGTAVFGARALGGSALAVSLEPLVGGASGGNGTMNPSSAGAGGGAIQLSSRTSVIIAGYLGASGAGGLRGSASMIGGGGGGSGGSILIEAPMVVLTGSLNVAGGGGASGSCGAATDGADGANATGRPSGGGTCSSGSRGPGGQGAGAGAIDGANGGLGSGGGGGAGLIRIRSSALGVELGGASFNPLSIPAVGDLTLR